MPHDGNGLRTIGGIISMKTSFGASARIFVCAGALLAGGAARGDSIIAPSGLPGSGVFLQLASSLSV